MAPCLFLITGIAHFEQSVTRQKIDIVGISDFYFFKYTVLRDSLKSSLDLVSYISSQVIMNESYANSEVHQFDLLPDIM